MNIKKMLRENNLELLRLQGLDYGRSFWRPILSRWLVWLGCSWAVGSVLVFAPVISRAIKVLFQ
jgi:hypothetical protein